MNYEKIYSDCYLIRAFEKNVENYFEKGKMRGTTHGCIGQEIIPVIIMENLDRSSDYITGTHRCHGQVLAYTHDPYKLACEMMGKKDGFNCGMGGSQHIKTEKYITNGVTGGMAAVGSGIAFSIKKRKLSGIVVSFLGDGGFQEGYVNETMSIASAFELPILYVLENNHYAMSTPTASYSAGTFESRVKALDIMYFKAAAYELDALENAAKEAIDHVRSQKRPAFFEVDTFRLCGHSKSDEMLYMTESEKKANAERDPLKALEMLIGEKNTVLNIQNTVLETVKKAFEDAENCEQIDYSHYKQQINRKDV